MTLADDILFGTAEQVKNSLERGEDPNEYDEYGFTPLIEASIAGKPDISNVLLNYKADVNLPDFAGRTPLHWAVENGNLALCELLLNRGANPNAYTNTGEPILVMPFLRQQDKLKTLLYKSGANLEFAKDYINGKLLGHRYELVGHSYLANTKNEFILLDLEGFFLEFSLHVILDSMKRFKRHYLARHFAYLFHKVEVIHHALATAHKLVKFQHYTTDLRKHEEEIKQLLNSPVLLIPATYQGHAITFIKFGDYFAKCDRGANSEFEGSVVIYEVAAPQKLTPDFLMKMLYEKQTDEFMHHGINQILGLTRILNFPIGPQITGNCSWANVEAAIPTLLFLLLLLDTHQRDNFSYAMKESMGFYEYWREWDKDRALDEGLQSFSQSSLPRNAAKALLLSDILFQTCNYENRRNIPRAEKILKILAEKQYHPYLENYVRVYYKDKWTEAGENLMHLFDMVSPKGAEF